jgi:uncharacterized membrane protein
MELNMFGLSTLGTFHTVVSLVALAAGIVAFARNKGISPKNALGQVYIWSTVVVCLTGFGIFEHGGFGKPHALGVMTLLVLVLAAVARKSTLFGRSAVVVETVCYSLTFFFLLVPGVTETFTRLPKDGPLFSSPDDPALTKVVGVIFLLFLIGVALQVRRIRSAQRRNPLSTHAA